LSHQNLRFYCLRKKRFIKQKSTPELCLINP